MKVINKHFICYKDLSQSFTIDFIENEYQSLTIGELIKKAENDYKLKHELFAFDTIQNQIQDFSRIDTDKLVKNSHVNLFPVYFKSIQVYYKINIRFNGETHTFIQDIYSHQTGLLKFLSQKFKVPQNRLYLLSESKPLKLQLQSYSELDLFVAPDKLFYNDQEIYVDFNLPVETNCLLFKFPHGNNEIYKGQKLISKSDTFPNQGICAEDKLYCYFMRKVQIKDVSTEIISRYDKKDALNLYLHYFPEEKGNIEIEEKEDVLHFSLNTKCEITITVQCQTQLSFQINTTSYDTIKSLKEQIFTQYQIPSQRQILVFNRNLLDEEEKTLDQYGILDESVINLTIRVMKAIQKHYTKQDLEKPLIIEVNTLTGQLYHVKCKLSDSVENLKDEISKQTDIPIDNMILIFCGQMLDNCKQLSDYNLEQSSVVLLVLNAQHTQKAMQDNIPKLTDPKQNIQIFVKSISGKYITLDCNTSDYTQMIKQMIKEIEGIPVDQQILTFSGKRLNDGYQIYEKGISDSSTIFLNLICRGGGSVPQNKCFVDLENESSKKQMSFSNKAPEYRKAGVGLNVEGICENNECKYYKKQVICILGYTSIEIIQDEQNEIHCPGCQKNVKIITCGFINCQYSWCGIKIENGKERLVQSQKILHADDNSYTTYDPVKQDGSSNVVEWRQLFLYAKKKEYYQSPQCQICLSQIFNEEALVSPEICQDQINHKCHTSCLEKLTFMDKKCIVCSPFI